MADFEAYILVEEVMRVSTILRRFALSDEPVDVLSMRICASESSLSRTKPSDVPHVRNTVPSILFSSIYFFVRFWYSVAIVTGFFRRE